MFPLVKDSSEATLTPYAIVGAPKLRFRWERVHVVYGLSLIGFSVYLSTRGVTKWLNPGQNCFEALGTNLSIATVVTKFDHCVQGSTSEEIQKILQHLDSSHWPKNAQKQLEFFILSTISLGTPNITASGFFSMRRPMFTANIRDCSGAAGEGAAVSRQARLLVTCNAGEGEPVPGLSRTFENFQRFPLSSPPARVYITLRQFYQW
ncbi:unnamed protein product, partial [Notodromas monacha]